MTTSCRAQEHRLSGLPAAGRQAAPNIVQRLLQTAALWHLRWLQRLKLTELTPEALSDMGIAPDQARREAAKPFWRA